MLEAEIPTGGIGSAFGSFYTVSQLATEVKNDHESAPEVNSWVSIGNKLTDDVIVLSFEELQAPQVGAELLKLEGELHVLVRLVTVEQ